MKRFITIFIAVFFCFSTINLGQVVDFKNISMDRMIEIVKAEDELRFDKTLEDFMKHPNPLLRKRAALAAGRIGDKKAIPILERLLMKDTDDIRQMAAFAIGEVESIKAVVSILAVLKNTKNSDIVRARAIEAAGKIAAANSKDPKAKMLGEAILDNLEFEDRRGSKKQSKDVILLGLTATLRAKPEEADFVIAKFLTNLDGRIRADAGNTMARLRAKNANKKFQAILLTDENPIARANAARALGAAGDKTAINLLLEAATTETDLRVRINAIRALSGLKEVGTANKLLNRAEELFAEYKKSKYENPPEENELLTLATALGRILQGTDNARAVKFLNAFRKAEKHTSPEVEIALVRVSPTAFARIPLPKNLDLMGTSGFVAGLGETAGLKEEKGYKNVRSMAMIMLRGYIENANTGKEKVYKSFPAILRAYARFKTDDLSQVLRDSLKHDDVIIRSTAASLLGDIEPSKVSNRRLENYFALTNAFGKSRKDTLNDATISTLNAIKKQYEKLKDDKSIKIDLLDPIKTALYTSPDYFVRRRALQIMKDLNVKPEVNKNFNQIDFKPAKNGLKSRVKRADYKKALSRRNRKWGVILNTEKGRIGIELFPNEAPLTVDNFINLARSGYFNGLAIHRVVPNFVVQDGDPRGDGSGGPGWQIRCEINQIQYKRGMVGMALAGKDSGGSQWFVTHSPQPHLDGGYTIFGKVNENDMKIVDNLARGDKIISVNIIWGRVMK